MGVRQEGLQERRAGIRRMNRSLPGGSVEAEDEELCWDLSWLQGRHGGRGEGEGGGGASGETVAGEQGFRSLCGCDFQPAVPRFPSGDENISHPRGSLPPRQGPRRQRSVAQGAHQPGTCPGAAVGPPAPSQPEPRSPAACVPGSPTPPSCEVPKVRPRSLTFRDAGHAWETHEPPGETRGGREDGISRAGVQPPPPRWFRSRPPGTGAPARLLCGRGTSRWRPRSPGFRAPTAQPPPGRRAPAGRSSAVTGMSSRGGRLEGRGPRWRSAASRVLGPGTSGRGRSSFFSWDPGWEGRLPGSRCSALP